MLCPKSNARRGAKGIWRAALRVPKQAAARWRSLALAVGTHLTGPAAHTVTALAAAAMAVVAALPARSAAAAVCVLRTARCAVVAACASRWAVKGVVWSAALASRVTASVAANLPSITAARATAACLPSAAKAEALIALATVAWSARSASCRPALSISAALPGWTASSVAKSILRAADALDAHQPSRAAASVAHARLRTAGAANALLAGLAAHVAAARPSSARINAADDSVKTLACVAPGAWRIARFRYARSARAGLANATGGDADSVHACLAVRRIAHHICARVARATDGALNERALAVVGVVAIPLPGGASDSVAAGAFGKSTTASQTAALL